MSKPALINFSLNCDEIEQQLASNHLEECDLLIIINVPSAAKGLELISKDWFKSAILSRERLYGINFRVDEKFNLKHFLIEFSLKDSFFVAFQSTSNLLDCKTFWKVSGFERSFSLFITNDQAHQIVAFFHEFLANELRNGRSGILDTFETRNEIQLQEIGDNNDQNLLIVASSLNRLPEVQKLIDLGFDVDYADSNKENAIDHAWNVFINSSNQNEKNQSSKIILNLLQANSTFPTDFEYETATKELQDFVDICESLHECVDNDNFDELKERLSKHPTIINFYNRNNQSLLAHALKSKKYDIVKYLDKGFTIGYYEDLEEVYEHAKADGVDEEIRNKHLENVKVLPESHLLVLQICSKIGSNDRLFYKRWRYIREAYATLNSDQYCSKILKVVAECKSLQIIFDFVHDTVFYLNPTRQVFTVGTVLPNGTIYIGAKYLMCENEKYEVLGAMAHEFAHLAIHMTYMNGNFDPFSIGDSEEKHRFINQVMPQCKKQNKCEEIIENVYQYAENLQDSEMIVTFPQMLMQYIKNGEIIERNRITFSELFSYSIEVVEPELERTQVVLKMLRNDNHFVKFDDLTNPMKAKILHSKIKFQEEEVSFFELIGNDIATLQRLSNEQIRNILCKDELLEFCKIGEKKSNHGLVERSYINTELYDDICRNDRSNREKMDIESWIQANKMNFEEIKSESMDSKIFVLSDRAGTGKTTSFEEAAIKLKQNKIFWTYFINLRKNVHIFEECDKNVEKNLNLPQVLQILSKCVVHNSQLELSIFVHLFLSEKLIFLFDGVDEVSPQYTKLLERMFMTLKHSSTKNQVWISTRPHYVKKLKELLKCSTYQFAPYTNDEKKAFIKEVLKHKEIYNSNEQDKFAKKIFNYVSQLDFGLISTQQVDNSLMLRIVSELFAENAIDVNVKGNYGIYAAMYQKQKQKQEADNKVEFDEKDKIEDFPIVMVHQVLALKAVIEEEYQQMLNFNLNELVIMKTWNSIKDKFTTDMIQRYGFVIVDLQNIDDQNSINFIHRVHAEFFVAKFFVKSIFFDNFSDDENEIVRKFEILSIILNGELMDFILVREFIISYLKNESSGKAFHKTIKSLITQKILQIHKDLDSLTRTVIFNFGVYANFCCTDKDLLKILWKTNQKNNVLKQFIYKPYGKNYSTISTYAEYSYGSEWHEVLSGKKLITDEEIEALNEDHLKTTQWEDFKNLLKFCDLVDESYTKEEKLKFYSNVDLATVGVTKVRWNIIPRLRKYAYGKQFVVECMAEICERVISPESMAFVVNQFDLASNIDRKLIKKNLSGYIPKVLHNTYDSDEKGIFESIKKFFMKYFSIKEIQDFIITSREIFHIFEGAEHLYYAEYKKFIQDIFGPSAFRNIIVEIENYYRFGITIDIRKFNALANVRDLLLMIYSNNTKRVNEIFSSIMNFVPE